MSTRPEFGKAKPARTEPPAPPTARPFGPVPRLAAAAGAAPAVSPDLRVLGIEAVQSVQDLAQSVRLIAGKATVVRVYVEPASPGLSAPVRVGGELVWRRSASVPFAFLPSMNSVEFVAGGGQPSLTSGRHDIGASLNFLLPAAATTAGDLQLRLQRVIVLGGPDANLQLPPDGAARTVTFRAAPPLRVRLLGLRYLDPATGQRHAPDAIHFEFARSWFGRAWPVAVVEWSQIVVDANFSAPFVPPSQLSTGTTGLANAQVAALRASDMAAGVDPRTHYYGLVSDAGGAHFLRGLAFGIPAEADPSVVASGPAGVPNGFSGDTDRSYADWYSAHELGHTFGRFHPGFPPGQQDASDPAFPFPGGQLSPDDDAFVGFDIGDVRLSLPMRALPGRIWHDVMTYADNQWLSAYTYEAIYQRLLAEDALGPLTV